MKNPGSKKKPSLTKFCEEAEATWGIKVSTLKKIPVQGQGQPTGGSPVASVGAKLSSTGIHSCSSLRPPSGRTAITTG